MDAGAGPNLSRRRTRLHATLDPPYTLGAY